MLKLSVNGQRIDLLFREPVADQQIAFVDMCFLFSADWDNLDKTAQFEQNEKTYNVYLGTDTVCRCLLPAELQTGCVSVSVFGYAPDCSVRATTIPIVIGIKRSGFNGGGETPIPPTPDLYAQLLNKIDNKIFTVSDGASAYEIAVENGFIGTEADWLVSLRGEPGDQGEPGTDGANGQDGQDGKSAYQIWLDAGNTGTETDFLESLKGTDGAPGSDGQNGADGFSPTAKVEKSGSVITITVTDINGTTTASITEGAAVDLTPYAPIAYVDEQIQNVHTHSNLETLEEITETIWVDILEKNHSHPNYVAVNALTMTHLDNISQCANAIQGLKLQIGDIQTALANIVEVTE